MNLSAREHTTRAGRAAAATVAWLAVALLLGCVSESRRTGQADGELDATAVQPDVVIEVTVVQSEVTTDATIGESDSGPVDEAIDATVVQPDAEPETAADDGDACGDCSDDLPCTLDFCDGGSCQHQVTSDACLVGERCYSAGEVAEDDPCLRCLPDQSRVALSTMPSMACDDGNPCSSDETCDSEGVCMGTRTDMDREPNDTPDLAMNLGTMTVPSDFPSGFASGNLGTEDVDIFFWNIARFSDVPFRPRARLYASDHTTIELCLYLRCGVQADDIHPPAVTCQGGSEATLHQDAVGCCRSYDTGITADDTIEATCMDGTLRSVAFLRVRALGEVTECGPYTVQWGAD